MMNDLQVLANWSSWFERLLFNHLWQATLFFVLAWLASRILARGQARARYLIWLAAAFKFAIPSAFIFVFLSVVGINPQSWFKASAQVSPTLQYVSPLISPIVVPATVAPESQRSQPEQRATSAAERPASGRVPVILALVWFLGCGSLLLHWCKRRRQISRAIKAGRVLRKGKERETLDKVLSWLRVRRPVGLVVTSAVREPGVWGTLRPVVLLPEEISGQLNDAELESLMMHEMAHVLRWDNLVSNLNMMLCCLFWFNPIVWFIDRSLLKEREEACDEVVVRWSGAREIYASGIKKIYRLCLSSHVRGLSAARGSNLKRRLERISASGVGDRLSVGHRLLVFGVILTGVCLSLAAGLTPSEIIVARTSGALSQASQLVDKVVKPERTDCVDATGKKCEYGFVATITEGQLASVVVRVAPDAPAQPSDPHSYPLLQEAVRMRPTVGDKPVPESPVMFQTAHPVDLRKFVGRYGVNPAVMENFVFDVSLQEGDLWYKPSHSERRRLVARSTVEYQDSKETNIKITFTLDTEGNVQGLTLRGRDVPIVADRLVLPGPSLKGNITFRLSGFPNAQVVAVAGSFNGWNQSQYLFAQVDGEWICRLSLPRGTYQYKFIIDGNWLIDPNNPNTVHDERDIENSLLKVQ